MPNPVTGPFQGIKVVDLSTVIAGPMAAALLADQGAEVVKVEAMGLGDLGRYIGSSRNGMSSFFHMANRGKRSIAIDLKKPEGADIVKGLARTADVLIQNFRPGVVERLGIDYPALSGVNPGLVYLSISGFGKQGPLAKMPVYDNIMQCFAGFAMVERSGAAGEPRLIQNIIADKITALNGAQAVAAALYNRAMGRGGQHVELAMLDASVAFLWGDCAMEEALLGEGVQVETAPAKRYRLVRFKGGWGSISPVTDQAFHGMCRAFGIAGADEPALASAVSRMMNLEAVAVVMRRWEEKAAAIDVDEAITLLQQHDVPCAKVMALGDLPGHPQVVANGLFEEGEHPVMGAFRQTRPAAQFSHTPAAIPDPAPMLGQHTDAILAELGMSDRIAALRGAGVVA